MIKWLNDLFSSLEKIIFYFIRGKGVLSQLVIKKSSDPYHK
jgi:hypothetical protein